MKAVPKKRPMKSKKGCKRQSLKQAKHRPMRYRFMSSSSSWHGKARLPSVLEMSVQRAEKWKGFSVWCSMCILTCVQFCNFLFVTFDVSFSMCVNLNFLFISMCNYYYYCYGALYLWYLFMYLCSICDIDMMLALMIKKKKARLKPAAKKPWWVL